MGSASKKGKGNAATAKKPTNPTSFKSLHIRQQVRLPPRFSRNPMDGARLYLNRFHLRYVPEIDSIVLASSNIKPETECAKIVNDTPYMHFDVRAQLTVFKPKIGTLLVGVVNKVSPDHIGLLIHGVFNASIPAAELRLDDGEFWWDEEVASWKRKAPSVIEEDVVVKTGCVLRFSVLDLMKAHDMLTIVGSLRTDPKTTGVIPNFDGSIALPTLSSLSSNAEAADEHGEEVGIEGAPMEIVDENEAHAHGSAENDSQKKTTGSQPRSNKRKERSPKEEVDELTQESVQTKSKRVKLKTDDVPVKTEKPEAKKKGRKSVAA